MFADFLCLFRRLVLLLGISLLSTVVWAQPDACTKPLRLRLHTAQLGPLELQEVDWLKRVTERAHCVLQVVDTGARSTARQLQDLHDGNAELMIGMSRRPEREPFLYFSVPYGKDHVYLYARRIDLARWQDLDLAGIVAAGGRITGPVSGWYGETYEQFRARNLRTMHYIPFHYGMQEGLRNLRMQRADVLVENHRTSTAKLLGTDLIQLPQALYEENMHIAFSRMSVPRSDFERLNASIVESLRTGDVPYAE